MQMLLILARAKAMSQHGRFAGLRPLTLWARNEQILWRPLRSLACKVGCRVAKQVGVRNGFTLCFLQNLRTFGI